MNFYHAIIASVLLLSYLNLCIGASNEKQSQNPPILQEQPLLSQDMVIINRMEPVNLSIIIREIEGDFQVLVNSQYLSLPGPVDQSDLCCLRTWNDDKVLLDPIRTIEENYYYALLRKSTGCCDLTMNGRFTWVQITRDLRLAYEDAYYVQRAYREILRQLGEKIGLYPQPVSQSNHLGRAPNKRTQEALRQLFP